MLKTVSGAVVLAMLLISVAGCDPEALIKSKVPAPVQSVLTLGESSSRGKLLLTPSVVEIISPKADEAYPSSGETIFEVKLKPPDSKPLDNPSVSWVLFPQGKQQVQLGQGLRVKRKLETGKYRAEATLTVKDQTVSQSVSFRAALIVTGKVISGENAPLPGVELELWDNNDIVISKIQSENDGKFALEFPSEGPFRVTASKKEYSFVPLEMKVKYGPEAKVEFKGSKAEISDIRITESEDSASSMTNLCPGQEVFLRLRIKSESKVTKIEAQLVFQDKEGERAHPFENVGDAGEFSEGILRVRVPTFQSSAAPHYRLRVNAVDEKGNRFSANSRDLYKMDILECFRIKLAEANAAHQKGKLAEAARDYGQIEEYYRIVTDPAPYMAAMAKVYYNRGLADLAMALSLNPDDKQRRGLLSRAAQEFAAALRIRKTDVDALFFRGFLSHISKNYDTTVQDYSEVLRSDPQFPGLHKLRAMAYVGTGIKKNMLLAIYDLSDALKSDPTNKALRKSRAEILKAYAENSKQKDEVVLDTSQIQLPDLQEGLDLNKIHR